MQVSHVPGFLKCDWIRILNRTEEIISHAQNKWKKRERERECRWIFSCWRDAAVWESTNGEAKSFSGSPLRTQKRKKLGGKKKNRGSVQLPVLLFLKEEASRGHSHGGRRKDQKKLCRLLKWIDIWKKDTLRCKKWWRVYKIKATGNAGFRLQEFSLVVWHHQRTVALGLGRPWHQDENLARPNFLARFDNSYTVFVDAPSVAVIDNILTLLQNSMQGCEQWLFGVKHCQPPEQARIHGKNLWHYDLLIWHGDHHFLF